MSFPMKLPPLEIGKLVRSVHFWIILVISTFLVVLYYSWQEWFPLFWGYFYFENKNNIIGSLFLIPFLYASVVFWWRGSLIVWLLSSIAMLPRLVYLAFNFGDFARNVALSFVSIALVVAITLNLKWREQQKNIVLQQEMERQIYISEVFKAQEHERQRISQELHDDTVQELLWIVNRAQQLTSGRIPIASEVKECGDSIIETALSVSEGVRRISRDLRPSILDNVGLVLAIEWLTERLDDGGSISSRILVKGSEINFATDSEVMIFRIIQEALNNVRRHSMATEVLVAIEYSPESVTLRVEDNGRGFIVNNAIGTLASERKLGIIGMRQRANFLNGTIDIHSQLGKGTSVSIKIPT